MFAPGQRSVMVPIRELMCCHSQKGLQSEAYLEKILTSAGGSWFHHEGAFRIQERSGIPRCVCTLVSVFTSLQSLRSHTTGQRTTYNDDWGEAKIEAHARAFPLEPVFLYDMLFLMAFLHSTQKTRVVVVMGDVSSALSELSAENSDALLKA